MRKRRWRKYADEVGRYGYRRDPRMRKDVLVPALVSASWEICSGLSPVEPVTGTVEEIDETGGPVGMVVMTRWS